MWKLLIADDEPKIRKGIRSIVESEMSNVEVAAEAEDGETALELARKTLPDIFLLDINMPFLNGIELIEKLEREKRATKTIIISGYDEFEYAQKALKLRVFDYILKPFEPELLVQTINKAITELEAEQQNRKYLEWAEQQLERNIPQIKESFFNDLVNGILTPYEIDRQTDFLNMDMSLSPGLILIKIEEKESRFGPDSEMDRYLILFAAQNIIEEILSNLHPVYVFRDAQSNIVCLVNMVSNPDLSAISLKIKSLIEQYLNRSVLICCDLCSSDLSQLPDIYKKVLDELKTNATVSPIVRRIKDFIDNNYSQSDLSLQDVAGAINISPSYLSRLLKDEEGHSFVEYLTIVRIKTALRLMNDPTLKISDIAERVGYSTQHYFSTAFKKLFGVSPNQYRRGSNDSE
jgi:two-component system response regulator YesN